MSLMLGVVSAAVSAQSAPEPALKAAFLYNFAKFAEWPADAAPADPLTICVLADAAIANALDETVKGRTIDARKSRRLARETRRAPRVPRALSDGSRRETRAADRRRAAGRAGADRQRW